MIELQIVGDFAPTRGIASACFDLNHDEGRIYLANLEVPLFRLNQCVQRPKAGPHLSGDPQSLDWLGSRRFIMALANNHMMDFGYAGIEETKKYCDLRGILYGGAGNTLEEALQEIRITDDSISLGVLSRSETQFGVASRWQAGVAPLVEGEVLQKIRKLSMAGQQVIASIHAGAEMSPWPSPRRQAFFRRLIDAGAIVVHGHHSHIPQAFERYNGGYIFYGLGNFLADPSVWRSNKETLWSLAPHLCIDHSGVVNIEYKTFVIRDDLHVKVCQSNCTEQKTHDSYFSAINSVLDDPRSLEALWQEISIRLYQRHFSKWLGFVDEGGMDAVIRGVACRWLNMASTILKKPSISSSRKMRLLRYHLVACEAHRDAIETALGVLSGELEDLRDRDSLEFSDRFAAGL